MVHTDVDHVVKEFETNYGGNTPDSVFFTVSRDFGTGTVGDWDTINLQTPFEYNGVDNLLVEVTWNGQDGGDGDCIVQYGFSPDGTHRRTWQWNWQATSGFRTDNCSYNTLIGFEGSGIVEVGPVGAKRLPAPLFVSGTLELEGNEPASLLDVNGRRVMGLVPGANPLRVAPGVYYLQFEQTRQVRRVIVGE